MKVLHLAGSPVDPLLAEVSLVYARDCLSATAPLHEALPVYVAPGGDWCLPGGFGPEALAAAKPLTAARAIDRIADQGIDAVLPQMFCRPGMTSFRAIWEVLGTPVVGNTAEVMAVGADKWRTKAVLSAAGIDVPAATRAARREWPAVQLPAVVKPADADNSAGVSLVRTPPELADALDAAWAESEGALIETFIPPGREVRVGVLDLGGQLTPLPLEEYAVSHEHPVRTRDQKLGRNSDGDLVLMAKTRSVAWIVDAGDPVQERAQAVAVACHRALGCRDHSLWDIRIDDEGRPWVLEASLYCSFARQSVLCTMAEAAGIGLAELFLRSLDEAVGRGAASAVAGSCGG